MTAGPYGLGAELADEGGRVFAACWDRTGKRIAVIFARSVESARALIDDVEGVERATITGPGVTERRWRDRASRAWRTR